MKAVLISIGDELLSGRTLNTNVVFLGKLLEKVGLPVVKQVTVLDVPEQIARVIEAEWVEEQILIITGGLGPTLDDRTREAVAEAIGKKLVVSEDVLEALKQRYGASFPTLENQALVLEGATPFINLVGTAPAVAVREGMKALVLLPGVPKEMEPLAENDLVEWLKEEFSLKIPLIRKEVAFFDLSEHLIDEVLRTIQEKFPLVKYGIYPGIGEVLVELSAESASFLEAPLLHLMEAFGDHLFHPPLEKAIYQLFSTQQWTLSVAESCTGGMVAHRLTQVPHASTYFLGGMVTYSNAMKEKYLEVSSETLRGVGAVSRVVVEQMAKGIQQATNSDFSLAVTGIAGPGGGSDGKPVGTIWCASYHRDGQVKSWKLALKGDRERINTAATNSLFSHLLLRSKEYLL